MVFSICNCKFMVLGFHHYARSLKKQGKNQPFFGLIFALKPQHLVVKPYFFFSFPQYCIIITHSTWLDCSRLMSDFSVRSREFIKAYFCLKTHRFLPLYVLGNRSKALLLLIICKRTDSPTASRLRSEGTSLKPHRLNIRILIHQVFLQIRILPFLLQQQQPQLLLPSYQEQPISPLRIWNSTHPL